MRKIRAMAVLNKIPIVTTITGAHAAAKAILAIQAQSGAFGRCKNTLKSDVPINRR